MDDPKQFIQSTRLLIDTLKYVSLMGSLRKQVADCQIEWSRIVMERRGDSKDCIRELEDEIFGCNIELQCLEIKVNRLIERTMALEGGKHLKRSTSPRPTSTGLKLSY